MIQVSDLLTQVAAIKAQVDAIVVTAQPDLQPVADALTGLSSDITAKFPAPVTPHTT